MKQENRRQAPAHKIKAYSWILACAYLFCGVMLFFILAKSQLMFSDLAVKLPLLTRIVMAVGPSGWLCLMAAIGAAAVLKDLRFDSRALAPILTLVLGLLVLCVTVALLIPCFAINGSVA
jgi:type II secretory pathway component PulF